MMKLYLLAFSVIVALNLPAQYSIVPGQPVSGNYGFNEISQTIVLNSGLSKVSGCYVVVDCEAQGNGKAFVIKTQLFDLQQGSLPLSYQSIIAASVEINSPIFSAMQQTGKLPKGLYYCCYTLYQIGNPTPLAKECTGVSVTSDGMLILVSPADGQVINTLYPTFFWSYTDIPRDNPVTYSIKIVELKPGQTYTDAVMFNSPLVFEQNLQQSVFNYPPTAYSLDEDKKYVWQIEAHVVGRGKYLSEIWMFRFKKQKEVKKKDKNPIKPVQYAYLSKEASATIYTFTDKLNFRYHNEYTDTLLEYAIYKTGSKRFFRVTEKPVRTSSGINYYSFDIPNDMRQTAKQGDVFVLTVSNPRREDWKLKFIILPEQERKKGEK